jgi:hypothetical protein
LCFGLIRQDQTLLLDVLDEPGGDLQRKLCSEFLSQLEVFDLAGLQIPKLPRTEGLIEGVFFAFGE